MNEAVVIKPVTARSLPRIHGDLVVLLREVVNDGGTVGFLPPISTEEAAAYWDEVSEALAGGRRMLGARQAGRVLATVQLDLAMQTNGQHRAEVMKLLVGPECAAARPRTEVDRGRRGGGSGRGADAAGARHSPGRTLRDLSTLLWATGALASSRTSPEALDATLHATILFYKEL